jgi:hypothetical protein
VLSAIGFRVPELDAAIDIAIMHLERLDDAHFIPAHFQGVGAKWRS